MTKKKPLPPELFAECEAAQKLFLSKKNALKLNHRKIADEVGITPAAVAHYLNGTNALNAKFASALARLIGEPVESFSPRLASEIAALTAMLASDRLAYVSGTVIDVDGGVQFRS